MDLSLLIGVLGVVATIAFGVWGLVVTLRHRYPARLTFVREECISLFHDIVRNMPDLSILLKGNPVKETLVLLKGYLVNTGSKDITPDMVAQHVSVQLPTGFHWIDARVVGKSQNVVANANIESGQTLTFDLGLLRCNEYIKFQALAEVPSAELSSSSGARLYESIKFMHRIADTGAIAISSLPEGVPKYQRFKRWGFPIMVLLSFVMFGVMCWQGIPVQTNYRITIKSGETKEVSVNKTILGTLRVNNIDDGVQMMFSPKEFFSRDDLRPVLKEDKFDKVFLLFFLPLYLLLSVIFISSELLDFLKEKNLRKLLTTESKTTSG